MLNHKKIDFKNRKIYQNKDLIKIIYRNYYKNIKKNIFISNKKILELGSGGGNIKEVLKKCITSDQFKNQNIDRIENIYKIDFKKKLHF